MLLYKNNGVSSWDTIAERHTVAGKVMAFEEFQFNKKKKGRQVDIIDV